MSRSTDCDFSLGGGPPLVVLLCAHTSRKHLCANVHTFCKRRDSWWHHLDTFTKITTYGWATNPNNYNAGLPYIYIYTHEHECNAPFIYHLCSLPARNHHNPWFLYQHLLGIANCGFKHLTAVISTDSEKHTFTTRNRGNRISIWFSGTTHSKDNAYIKAYWYCMRAPSIRPILLPYSVLGTGWLTPTEGGSLAGVSCPTCPTWLFLLKKLATPAGCSFFATSCFRAFSVVTWSKKARPRDKDWKTYCWTPFTTASEGRTCG